MNIILFEEKELTAVLPHDDPRSVHIVEVLKLELHDEFTAGIVGGKRGRARLEARSASGWRIEFAELDDSPPLYPLTVVVGCPRPPVARRLLKDLTALGVGEIRMCSTDLNEKSYLGSKLWRDGLWRDARLQGAVQSGTTLVPEVRTYGSLARMLDELPGEEGTLKVALDNGPRAGSFPGTAARCRRAVLAVGPERGWSDRERGELTAGGFRLVRLGNRIFRTETACVLGSGLLLERLGAY